MRNRSKGHLPANTLIRLASYVALLGLGLSLSAGCRPRDDLARSGDEDSLSKTAIDAGLAERQSAVESCASLARVSNPAVGGELEVSGVVAPDGRTTTVEVARSNLGDGELERCIVRATSAARFPAAGAETPFTHTWKIPKFAEDRGWSGSASEPDLVWDTGSEGDSPPQMDRDSISDMLERDSEKLNACLAAAVERDPNVSGEIQLAWAIDPRGSVRSVVVTGGSIKDQAMHSCVTGLVRSWRFAPTGGSALKQASYTLRFEQQ